MKTAQNRAKVLAIVLRAAVKSLRGEPTVVDRQNALESVDVVAEELEVIANPRPKCCSGLGRGRGRCPNLATTRYRRTLATGQRVVYARCDRHPLSARVGGYEAESITAPDPAEGGR